MKKPAHAPSAEELAACRRLLAESEASARSAEDHFLALAYKVVALIVWAVTFFASWAYCVREYGYLLGVSLGWFPSLIVASIAALAWPLLALGAIALWLVYKS